LVGGKFGFWGVGAQERPALVAHAGLVNGGAGPGGRKSFRGPVGAGAVLARWGFGGEGSWSEIRPRGQRLDRRSVRGVMMLNANLKRWPGEEH